MKLLLTLGFTLPILALVLCKDATEIEFEKNLEMCFQRGGYKTKQEATKTYNETPDDPKIKKCCLCAFKKYGLLLGDEPNKQGMSVVFPMKLKNEKDKATIKDCVNGAKTACDVIFTCLTQLEKMRDADGN